MGRKKGRDWFVKIKCNYCTLKKPWITHVTFQFTHLHLKTHRGKLFNSIHYTRGSYYLSFTRACCWQEEGWVGLGRLWSLGQFVIWASGAWDMQRYMVRASQEFKLGTLWKRENAGVTSVVIFWGNGKVLLGCFDIIVIKRSRYIYKVPGGLTLCLWDLPSCD